MEGEMRDTEPICPVCAEQPLPPGKHKCELCAIEEAADLNVDRIARDLAQRTAAKYPQSTYDPAWEASQRRQARSDLGVDV